MANAKKVTTQDSTDTVNELIKRIEVLEEQAATSKTRLVKAMRSAGSTIGQFYGMGAVGQVFDAVADSLEK